MILDINLACFIVQNPKQLHIMGIGSGKDDRQRKTLFIGQHTAGRKILLLFEKTISTQQEKCYTLNNYIQKLAAQSCSLFLDWQYNISKSYRSKNWRTTFPHNLEANPSAEKLICQSAVNKPTPKKDFL